MAITVEKNVNGIEGLCVITPKVFGDDRGYFMETYNENDMKAEGLDYVFVQDNQSASKKGVYVAFIFRRISHRISLLELSLARFMTWQLI